ncbi:MAG: MutS-related protein [Chitinophagaceae bacterium]
MEIDKTTYHDLSIFNTEEESSIFHQLNFTLTNGGKEELKKIFLSPLQDLTSINGAQEVVKYLYDHPKVWPSSISNGTIIMLQEYLSAKIPTSSGTLGFSYLLTLAQYKTTRAGDYAFILYSLSHLRDFLKGYLDLAQSLPPGQIPPRLESLLSAAASLMKTPECWEIAAADFNRPIPMARILSFDFFIRNYFRHRLTDLIALFYQLDAWHSMGLAVRKYQLAFPVFLEGEKPQLKAKGLYHILLSQPVGNEVSLDRSSNFLFLTGANMAGKSTIIKAIGIAVFLAHIGMGVPAQHMELTWFDGMLSNIQVQDNILLGESLFFNEVQRIKNTLLKIDNRKNWLILIDELFKGTNIEDAKNCSLAVIRGMSKVRNSIFILSTHLYEIAAELQDLPHIRFQYLESLMEEGSFCFNYHLKDGISKDRLGFLILKREKVLDLLENMGKEDQESSGTHSQSIIP